VRQGRFPGYATIVDPVLGTKEQDTFTCVHCNNIVHVAPYLDPASVGGLCRVCGGLICSSCVGKGCDPIEERTKRIENCKTIEEIGNAIIAGANPWRG